MTSLKFGVVLNRIRLFPTLISNIKWLGSRLPLKKKVGYTGRPKSNFLLDYNLTYSHENSNAKGNYRKWECNVSFQVDLGSKNLDYFHFRWFNIMFVIFKISYFQPSKIKLVLGLIRFMVLIE